MELTLVHLYPRLMNIYGDMGNVAALTYRCRRRGIKLKIRNVNPGDCLTAGSFDWLFAGGGQDSQQIAVSRDLPTKAAVLTAAANQDIPMLTICGSYQLFGRYFQPFSGPKLPGLAIFPAYTIASKIRKIGNILIDTPQGQLVGFENHSGNTWLEDKSLALGQVSSGFGNNGQDQTEGCRINQVIGCYLHGSLLPKNPIFADSLIAAALKTKYHTAVSLKPLDDRLEWRAHESAVKICYQSGW